MKVCDVGIVFRFHADDDAHAVEQFMDMLDIDDPIEEQFIRDSINYLQDVEEA